MAIGLITYQDSSRREDLIDVVTNVSPADTPLLSNLPDGPKAKQTLHEYTTDTFASSADNAQAEGSAFSATDLTQPTRSDNITQIFRDDIQISGTEQEVTGVTDAATYQAQKNMKEHAKDIELAFMAGSRASGSSGSARRLEGVINAISTNATTRNSGSSLGETTFNDIMEMIWDETNEVATDIYVGGTLKRDISGFTDGVTKNVDADDKRLTKPVAIYESDFGVHKIHLHRDVKTGANDKGLVAINPEYVRKSFLRPTQLERLAKDGDRDRWQVVTEVTLEHRAEKTGAHVDGFTS